MSKQNELAQLADAVTVDGDTIYVDSNGQDAGYNPLQIGNTSYSNTIVQILSANNGVGTIHFGDAASGSGRYIGFMNYDHTIDQFQIGTNASSRFKIDASGRVTTPNQPFFSSTWNQSGTGFVTNYNNILINNGGFTITSGKIYVPVAGYYFINAYGIAQNEFDTRVVANTTSDYPFVFDFRQSDYASGTHHGCGNGRVFYLASGSYVGIYRLGGTMYSGAGASNPHNLISIMLMG